MEQDKDIILTANIHGPTQKYYYLKMKQAQKFAKKILEANPYEPDKQIWHELWTDAQHFMKPKPSSDQFIEIIDYDEEEDTNEDV